MCESRGQIDGTCTASCRLASALRGATGTQTPLGKEAQLDFLPIPSLISPPTVGIGPTPMTLRGGGGPSAKGSAGDESIFSSQGGGGGKEDEWGSHWHRDQDQLLTHPPFLPSL